MPAGKLDLLIEKGATFRRSLVWKQGDIAVDLTGYTARMQLRTTQGAVVLELTTENGRIVLQTPGRIDLYISAVDTTNLVGVNAKYDLEMVCGEEVVRLVQGTVTLSSEVTKELS
jgi:hypothetical protein